MNGMRMLIAAGLVLATCGCAAQQTKVRSMEIDTGKSTIITYPAQVRGAYLFKPGENIKMCSEPVPDVAMESLEKLTASLKETTAAGLSLQPELAYELSSKAIELAGRTQLVLLAREMLFRACELSINNGDAATAKSMFNKIIEVIGDMATSDKTKAETENKKAEEALIKAKKAAGAVFDGGEKQR